MSEYLNPKVNAQTAVTDARRTLDQARADCDASTERTFAQLHATLGGLEAMHVMLNTDIEAYTEVLERVTLMHKALCEQRDLCQVMINGTRDAVEAFSARPEYGSSAERDVGRAVIGDAYVKPHTTPSGYSLEQFRKMEALQHERERLQQPAPPIPSGAIDKSAMHAAQVGGTQVFPAKPAPEVDKALTDTLRTAMDNVDNADAAD